MNNTLQSTNNSLASHQSDLLGNLPVSARVARAVLSSENIGPEVVTSQELRLRRMTFKIIAQSTQGDIELALAEDPSDFGYDYSDSVVYGLVDHYSDAMEAALDDPELLETAIKVAADFERFASSQASVRGSERKPVNTLLKKIHYSQTKKEMKQEKLNRIVRGYFTNLVSKAVHEGANTVYALFEVIPAVLNAGDTLNNPEQFAKECESLARTVARLGIEWSGLSKMDDKRAALALSDQKPDSTKNQFDRLRFNPDYFYQQICPKTGRAALGIRPEALTFNKSNEVRYGCPAYARGGITKMCRAIEKKLIADQYYLHVQRTES